MHISKAHTVSVSQDEPNMHLAALTVPVPMRKPSMKTNGNTKTLPHPSEQFMTLTQVNFSEKFMGFKTGLQKLLPIPESKADKDEKPLSSVNAALYRKIFMLQEQGDMEKADEYIAKLTDHRLRGHYLYQRYMHPTAYRSSYEELKDWYVNYADHPNADKVYKLAMSRKPAGDEGILNMKKVKYELPAVHEPSMYIPKRHLPKINRTSAQYNEVRSLSRKIRALVRSGSPTNALNKLNASEASAWMDNAEKDKLKAQIALGYMYAGNLTTAKKISSEAYARSGNKVPIASWVAAMSSWMKKDYATAAAYFEKTGTSPYASGWQASAGSFWAARAHMRAKNVKQVSKWLKNAAEHSRTFYGLLARRSLGQNFDFNWEEVPFTNADERQLLATPEGKRAAALIAIGQYRLAEEELLHFDFASNPEMRRIVLGYASHYGLPNLSVRLASMLNTPEGKHYDTALYPVIPWEPKDGYKLDPALVHAVVRQESRFNPAAESYSGAKGLMQIMPITARHVLKDDPENRYDRYGNPDENLSIGQDYVQELMRSRHVKGDIASMLVAYNAGPGNLAKWKRKFGNVDDPILFIEMIPVHETRTYVKRVLSNYWIYRLRGGQSVPTLEALSTGKLPQYAHIMGEGTAYRVAANQ